MVDAKETPLAAVIDDSRTVQYIEITPLNRPSDDCYKSESIDRVVEVKPEDLQDVKQEPADETDNESNISEIASLDRPFDDSSLSAADDCYQLGSIDPVVEVKPEDLQDVKQELAVETDNETNLPDTVSHDRLSDNCSLWLFANDDCYNAQSIEPVVEVKPEDLQDVKQEPAVETDSEGAHYSVKVTFCLVGNCSD